MRWQTRRDCRALALVAMIAMWALGCGEGPCELASGPGQKVVVDCVTRVTLHDAGNGFTLAPPAGSKCSGETSYTLELAGGVLSWSVCTFNNSSPRTLDQGMRTLSDAELHAALSGLHSVTVWDRKPGCGADKPTLTIEVSTSVGTQRYTDSFYACSSEPGAIYVDSIDTGFEALSKLAHL